MEALLTDIGRDIVKARSGAEALRHLLREEFAVILLDVNMPEMDGFETAMLIRQRRKCEHIPIIFVTAISTTETHSAKGYSLGAVDYIFTPVVPEILKAKVAVFVELLRKRQETKRQEERLRQIEERAHRRRMLEAAQQLEIEARRNRFFNLSIDMLAIIDFAGKLKGINPAWAKALGHSEPTMLERQLIEFAICEDQQPTLQFLDRLKQSEKPGCFEMRCVCRDGSRRWLAGTAVPFKEEQLFYLFVRDVTEHKFAEEEIRSLNSALLGRAAELEKANHKLQREIGVRKIAEAALKETNSELEAFTYSVSHDLRAPLRAMQGFAEALLEDCRDKLDDLGREYADRIICAATRMDTLIQDLLTYSRVSHNELELQMVEAEYIVAQALHQLDQAVRESGAKIDLQPRFFSILAHQGTAVQVACNLISNAIKFVAPGLTPHVRIRMEQLGEYGRLWVEDNGIGIAPEFHQRIFRVFERLHGSEKYPGTGVGLAIVRKGIERMGGRVGVESAPGQGSRFWADLRLRREEEGSVEGRDSVAEKAF